MRKSQLLNKGRSDRALKLAVTGMLVVLLGACGGGGSSKSTAEKVPDAYKATTASNQTAKLKGTGNLDGVETGVIELSWSAPSTRTDGEPLSLSEINGYRIYYGTEQGEYIKGADIKDGSAESVTVTNVPVGEYYVVMTTYDADGIESDYSSAIMKIVG